MDVKYTFLNGFIYEEVYVKQPPSFENETFLHHIFKLSKALCGLKKFLKLSMKDLALFCLKMVLKEEKLIQSCLSCIRKMISLFFRFI